MTATQSRHSILVEVEEALGPGLEYDRDLERGGIVLKGARGGGLWLGADRAFLVDSDDGHGRAVPVLVALSASSFVGARIDAELVGGFSDASGLVLVARLPGAAVPIDAVLRSIGRVSPDAEWIDGRHGSERAAAAKRAFRERRGRGRITGGLVWRPPGDMSAEALRAGGVYSRAERSLDRLLPRFLRGLEGMLDPDERLRYSIERPWRSDAGLLTRLRDGRTHRSGLLLLTDREVLWLVDHMNPDSYLSDWGVDVDMVPVEQLTGVRVEDERETLRLVLQTPGGRHNVALPVELEAEVRVFESMLSRFLPDRNRGRLRRVYATEAVEFVEETAERFHQLDEARTLQEAARNEAGDLLAFVYSPRREGQRHALGLWLSPSEVGVVGPRPERLSLRELRSVGVVLSPLIARVTLRGSNRTLTFTYPAPLAVHGAALVRQLRRLWANGPGVESGPAQPAATTGIPVASESQSGL
jgi:hypothetical protein